VNHKITVIGGGHVGATTAHLLAERRIGDVVLVDIAEGVAQGKALDMAEAGPLWNTSVSVVGTSDYDATAGSHMIIVTAGLARRPGMSRDDLLQSNAKIVRSVVEASAVRSPDAIIVVVTNPMDVMAQLAWKTTGFDHRRVIGMGGILDSARFRTFIAMELGVSVRDVTALVLGGHGDQMVPLPRYTSVAGIPITELMDGETIARLIQRTRQGGAEIVGLLGTGSAYYAPAASTVEMAEAILRDEKRILPCAVYLDGQYGETAVYSGVPVKLGLGGAEEVIELKLDDGERAAFHTSAEAVRGLVAKIT